MYYKSVNRGISFTKSGTYTLCFVMLLGILAAASGYNSLFLALAFGSGLLITSGLLSERSIKPIEVFGQQRTFAEAESAFRLKVMIKNANKKSPLFGTEVVVTEKIPRFRLFHPELPAIGLSHFLRLIAGEERLALIPCTGLARGIYRELPLVLRTIYPFGLISKFKVSTVPAPLIVYPKVDGAFQNQLLQELRSAMVAGQSHPEFHSHRNYLSEDSARKIDWKKSAGKGITDWSIKVFFTPAENFLFVVSPDWGQIATSPGTVQREIFLSRVLTACETLCIQAPQFFLRLPHGAGFLQGAESVREYLADYPALSPHSASLPAHQLLNLVVQMNSHRWESSDG